MSIGLAQMDGSHGISGKTKRGRSALRSIGRGACTKGAYTLDVGDTPFALFHLDAHRGRTSLDCDVSVS